MAKFIKSIFHTGERKYKHDDEDKTEASPPLDDRRKLSISRSGRLKANKKRQTLSLDVYGQEENTDSKCDKSKSEKDGKEGQSQETTPEEEIDHAFEIIDKS
ncbi:uncharacterized protein LOC121737727 [Aricia agestis]|uniref:uncharacterized protein LOC121737727 n=1 Tax=Aricia agestis TaxID=91739 RepID=UPI001C20C2F8|nr:uncharacterized protein LOC121737727 [Aricia agestis]XP_041985349.1 uncharacterized protein LOC121737727 [Aricia agestis]